MSTSGERGNRPASLSKVINGVIIAVLGAAYFCLFVPGIPNHGDLDVAFPIVQELADPGLYAENDLLVQSGKRVPFYVYRMASLLYSTGQDVEAIWFMLYMVLLAATFYGVFRLGLEISGSPSVGAICVGVAAAMRYLRGGLHWSHVPQNGMVTSHVAIPILLFVLICLYQRRHLAALVLAAITFSVHPYTGLLALLAAGSVVVFSASETPVRKRLAWLAVAGLLCAPNAAYILLALPDNFGVGAAASSPDEFFDIFRIYAWHAFPEDHWHEGYAWVFINLAGIAFFARYLPPRHRRPTAAIVLAMIAAMVIYVLNLYTIQIRSLALAFLFRATYILKPIIIAVVVAGGCAWWREQVHAKTPTALRYLVVCGFGLMAFAPYIRAAEGIGLMTYGALLWTASSRSRTRLIAGVGGAIGLAVLALTLVSSKFQLVDLSPGADLLSVVAMCLCALLYAGAAYRLEGCAPVTTSTTGRGLVTTFVAVVLIRSVCEWAWLPGSSPLVPVSRAALTQRIRFAQPYGDNRGAALWIRANTPRGCLVAVPPVRADFSGFRLTSQRGVYITMHDINQLGYDTATYASGHRRLLSLGVQILGRHRFDASGYVRLGGEQLARLHREQGVDYAVFPVRGLNRELAAIQPVYRDRAFIIFDLRWVSVKVESEDLSSPTPERRGAERGGRRNRLDGNDAIRADRGRDE